MYTVRDIKNYTDKYHKIAKRALKAEKLNTALDALYHCGALQHTVNINLKDDISENLILELSYKYNQIKYQKSSIYCLFYDSIAVSNIALSMQYLKALISLGKKFIYLINVNTWKESASKDLMVLAKQCGNCEVIVVDSTKNMVEKIEIIRRIILEERPEKVLLHMGNSDPVGCVAFSNISGCTKYLINHGDEQFWLGATVLDYSIEFRGMGKDASVKYRGLRDEQCLVLPYYPVLKSEKFKGFDFQLPADAVRIFSGGRFTKVYAENGKFMEVITDILNRHPKAFFIFAGAGDAEPMKAYVKKKGLENRWKVIAYRDDLLEVLRRMDIYLGTYPQTGGLMAQYAVAAGLPIVEMDTKNGGLTEDLLPNLNGGYRITYESWKDYNEQVDNLIDDFDYRSNVSEKIKKSNISEHEFWVGLQNLLTSNTSQYPIIHREINLKIRTKRLLEAENRYMHRIPGIMCNRHMVRYYPLMAVLNFIRYIYFRKGKS